MSACRMMRLIVLQASFLQDFFIENANGFIEKTYLTKYRQL